jgi:hypothetical protein
MKNKELTAALGRLHQVLADPRLGTAHRENLRKGVKELEKVKRSGKLDQRKVFRAISLISRALVEMHPDIESPEPTSPLHATRCAR